MAVYVRIQHYLTEHHIDPAEVAQSAAIPPARLEAILEGRQTLYADDLRAICLALRVPPERFLEYHDT